ncbi:hypothetical protein Vafri_17966 [Volvox africanus]|uniref:Uncharacterized protein n=1 Tax=Volvox africanus TaxID=51714 RepID=A0A8J4F874_9CHLO|nr:hypothetical protein Vafri_17966 [Volvox africanus]
MDIGILFTNRRTGNNGRGGGGGDGRGGRFSNRRDNNTVTTVTTFITVAAITAVTVIPVATANLTDDWGDAATVRNSIHQLVQVAFTYRAVQYGVVDRVRTDGE